jgi:hypothetical protein
MWAGEEAVCPRGGNEAPSGKRFGRRQQEPESRVSGSGNIGRKEVLLYWEQMNNTVFLSWDLFKPNSIRLIKVCQSELTLVYTNDAQICLEFDDPGQMDTFMEHLLTNLGQEAPEHLLWN